MLGQFPLFALNYFFLHCLKKTALLLTNQNGEIFSCILLGSKQGEICVSCYKKGLDICKINSLKVRVT